MKPILDPMCGSRMFYFDKNNKSVLFGDIRDETHWTRQYKKLEIHPDQIMDARKLEFPDETFYLVVLDPPHLINCGKTSDMAKSYGVLEKEWHAGMKAIFDEAWRNCFMYSNGSQSLAIKSRQQTKPEQTVSF